MREIKEIKTIMNNFTAATHNNAKAQRRSITDEEISKTAC